MSRKQQVKCLETGNIYNSTVEAAAHIGCHNTAVSQCCTGKIKTCKGLHLEYVKHHPIIIHNKAEIEAAGNNTHKNCKSVTIRELNVTCDSVNEVAELLGVSGSSVSYALGDKNRTVHGYHVYFTKEAPEHMEDQQAYNRSMIARIPELEAKANTLDRLGVNEGTIDELARLRAYRDFKKTVDAMREEYIAAKTKYEQGMEMLAEMANNL